MSSCRNGSLTTGLASTSSTEDLLAVAGIWVLQAVLGVLDLDLREVLGRRAVEVHPSPREQREVHRVHRADQVEALPVGVVLALAADRGESPLRRGVGADHQRHIAETGQDVRAGALQRLRTAGAGGVAGADRHAVPAELLRERRPGDEARIAVADGVGPGDQLDLSPVQAGLGQCGARGDHAVFGEVAAPLAPGVHPGAEDVERFGCAHDAILQACTMRSTPSSSVNSGIVVSSISMPTFKSAASVPSTTLPSTMIPSSASSTAAMANGSNGSGSRIGRWRRVPVFGVAPQRPPGRQRDGL